jgi:hypothetical protein
MASASFQLSLALGETGDAAFVTLHSVLGRLSRLKLRPFSGVGLGSEATAKSPNLAFAVTGMTFSLATRRVNLDEYFIFGDPATQTRPVRQAFDKLACLPGVSVWASSRQRSVPVRALRTFGQ